MTARFAIPVLFTLTSLASAQTAREAPPDQKAYTEANKTAAPEKKIEALKKVKA